ncbi:MAG: GIY-YIG nuclease family protein [Patescibacteria group bacterium]
MRDKSFYVYILSSRFDTVLYVGVTNNLIRRVIEHRTGFYPKAFTKQYKIHRLVYYEVTNDPYVAIAREKEIKGWTRDRKNSLVNSTNPDWEDLYENISGL